MGSQTAIDTTVAAALAAIHRRNPKADPLTRVPGVHPGRLPRHIAIIMDGNGRWAQSRGLPRALGHQAGAETVRRVLKECVLLGVEYLTIYSFSMENWKRPADEVTALMELAIAYCQTEAEELAAEGVRVRIIGRREGLPERVQTAVAKLEESTASGTTLTMCIALNYGSRAEIVDAARSLARDAAAGRINPDDIDEALLASRLYTRGIPDPDLLIRTAGELRISNYLLWQISYAELYLTPVLWPEFQQSDLHAAVREFAARSRRFGGLSDEAAAGANDRAPAGPTQC